jgi:predicted phosphodiesterase
MRYLVLSDIHANSDALDAVLAVPQAAACEAVLVLGDLVGYGGDPNGVIARVQALAPRAIVRGNHDKIAFGLEFAADFNETARRSAAWTLETLTEANRTWLRHLPAGPSPVDDLLEICHGTPYDEDAYVFTDTDARRAIGHASRPLCLYGHTHQARIFELRDGALRELGGPMVRSISLPGNQDLRLLVNPGAVGQPRDGDPRAAYAIVDTAARTIELCREHYAIEAAQARILEAGLPPALAHRLAVGR